MGLYEWFFPEIAAAEHLRTIAYRKRTPRRTNVGSRKTAKRVDDLEEDLGYITLILGAILQKLDEKGTVTREEIRTVMADLDEVDGVQDGRLDINILKGISQ